MCKPRWNTTGHTSDDLVVPVVQAAWLKRLEQEHDNFRVALSRVFGDAADKQSQLRLAIALRQFWTAQGDYSEGRSSLERLLRQSDGISPHLTAQAILAAGHIAMYQGDFASEQELCTQSLSIFEEFHDVSGIAWSVFELGVAAMGLGDYAESRKQADIARQRFTPMADRNGQLGLARAVNLLGELARLAGDYTAARQYYEEAIAIHGRIGEEVVILAPQFNMAAVDTVQGDFESARRRYQDALRKSRALNKKDYVAVALEGFGGLAAARGHSERSARLFGAAALMRRALGAPIEPADLKHHNEWLKRAREGLTPIDFEVAWNAGAALTLEQALAYLEEDDHQDQAASGRQ